jgi:MAX-like protein X
LQAFTGLGQYPSAETLGVIRKRSHDSFSMEQQQQPAVEEKFGDILSTIFSVPSPVAMSPIYVEQKPVPMNGRDMLVTQSKSSPRTTPRPSPASTPPAVQMDSQRDREYKKRHDSGRSTPSGKRSRPVSPASDCDSDGSYRDREPLVWTGSGRMTPTETKPNLPRLEDLVDEDKYNKRKRSTEGGGQSQAIDKDTGRKKDPMRAMLEQLQSHIPHIGNPDEEKVSHAGLLVEGSDYIRSLMRENNTTGENVEALKLKIEQLNAEIEDFQLKLPEHGSSSINRIVSSRGKSIPDMFADHVRQRTQSDWRYWVFTSIMGHFVHSYSQDVSNISPKDMETTAMDWLSQRMSLKQLRKDAFRKLAKLCSKTSIMEDPLKLPDEARSFVALNDPNPAESMAESESYGRKF